MDDQEQSEADKQETDPVPNQVPNSVPSPKKKSTKPKSKYKTRVDKLESQAETIDLRLRGLTPLQISKFQGLEYETIKHRLKRFKRLFDTIKSLPEYQAQRQELMAAAEFMALNFVVKKLPAASCGDAVRAFDRLHNAGRLERNLSTANLASEVKTYSNIKTDDLKD